MVASNKNTLINGCKWGEEIRSQRNYHGILKLLRLDSAYYISDIDNHKRKILLFFRIWFRLGATF